MAFGKNRYQQDIERQKNGGGVVRKIQPMDSEEFEVNFDPEELEERAAQAVSPMQSVFDANAPTEEIELEATTEEQKAVAQENLENMVPPVVEESEKANEPDPEPKVNDPEEAPKKARPRQDPESKPMQGIVSEFFTVTPERLEQVQAMEQPAMSQELHQEFLEGKFDDAFLDDLGRVVASATSYLRLEAEARKEALAKEAAKWKTVLVVKDQDGKRKSLTFIYQETCRTIDLLPLSDEAKAGMRHQAFEDCYARSEAWQRHCESGEFRRFESAEMAVLKKESWRAEWDAKKTKKNNPAGKPAK